MAKAKPRVTVKSIITNGILNGWTMARILKTVKKKAPNSKANEQHVRVYASTMHKNKEIDLERKNKYLVRPKKTTTTKPKAVVKKKTTTTKSKAVVKKKAAKKKAAKRK